MGEATQSNLPQFNFKQAITHMVQRNGSDLLLKVGRPATIRVNGDLVALETAPLKPEELKSLAEQIMTPRQVKEFAEHKEADSRSAYPAWAGSGPTSTSSVGPWRSRSARFRTRSSRSRS